MSEQQYTIEEKLAEVLRELDHRINVYPFRVKMKVMRQEEADRRLAILMAIARDYRKFSTRLKAKEMIRTIELLLMLAGGWHGRHRDHAARQARLSPRRTRRVCIRLPLHVFTSCWSKALLVSSALEYEASVFRSRCSWESASARA